MFITGKNSKHRTSANKDISCADKWWIQCPGAIAFTTRTKRRWDYALSIGGSGV